MAYQSIGVLRNTILAFEGFLGLYMIVKPLSNPLRDNVLVSMQNIDEMEAKTDRVRLLELCEQGGYSEEWVFINEIEQKF